MRFPPRDTNFHLTLDPIGDRAFGRADESNEQKLRSFREGERQAGLSIRFGYQGAVRIYRSVQLEASPASADACRMEDGVKNMKKLYLIAAVMSVALMGYAGGARAQSIAGSLHDLSANGPGGGSNGTNTQVCVYCHTPHGSGTAGAPLWNRDTSGLTYTMYSSPTLDGAIATSPQGVSLACLSCHDGATGFDALINKPPTSAGTLTSGTMSGSKAVGAGGFLDNDHPISVTYGTDLQLVAASSGKVGGVLPLYGANTDQVECASCHNPHDRTNSKFLRKSTASSGLCLTCHVK